WRKGGVARRVEVMGEVEGGEQEANAIDWKIRRKGFVLWSLGLRQERKLSVAHGVLSRVDPTRGCSHFWRSPCAIEGETPWPPCKSGPSPAPASIFCYEKPRYGASRTDTTRRHALALAVLAPMVGAPVSAGAASPEGQLVETEWLTAYLDDSNVPVLDCTVAGSVRAEQ